MLLLFRALMTALNQARMDQAAAQHTMPNTTVRPQLAATTAHAAKNQINVVEITTAQTMALIAARVKDQSMLLHCFAAIAGAAALR